MKETLRKIFVVMWHLSNVKLRDQMQMCVNKMKDGGERGIKNMGKEIWWLDEPQQEKDWRGGSRVERTVGQRNRINM